MQMSCYVNFNSSFPDTINRNSLVQRYRKRQRQFICLGDVRYGDELEVVDLFTFLDETTLGKIQVNSTFNMEVICTLTDRRKEMFCLKFERLI